MYITKVYIPLHQQHHLQFSVSSVYTAPAIILNPLDLIKQSSFQSYETGATRIASDGKTRLKGLCNMTSVTHASFSFDSLQSTHIHVRESSHLSIFNDLFSLLSFLLSSHEFQVYSKCFIHKRKRPTCYPWRNHNQVEDVHTSDRHEVENEIPNMLQDHASRRW